MINILEYLTNEIRDEFKVISDKEITIQKSDTQTIYGKKMFEYHVNGELTDIEHSFFANKGYNIIKPINPKAPITIISWGL